MSKADSFRAAADAFVSENSSLRDTQLPLVVCFLNAATKLDEEIAPTLLVEYRRLYAILSAAAVPQDEEEPEDDLLTPER